MVQSGKCLSLASFPKFPTHSTLFERTPLDVPKLRAYVEGKVKGFQLQEPVYQFSFGQSYAFPLSLRLIKCASLTRRNLSHNSFLSNPTYLLNASNGKRYVVRTRPPGPLLSKTAHAIDREYRILEALGKEGTVPVPKVYHLCKDESVIGRQWYLMEYLQGRKFEDVRMPEIETKEEREQLSVFFFPFHSHSPFTGKNIAHHTVIDMHQVVLNYQDFGSSSFPRPTKNRSRRFWFNCRFLPSTNPVKAHSLLIISLSYNPLIEPPR